MDYFTEIFSRFESKMNAFENKNSETFGVPPLVRLLVCVIYFSFEPLAIQFVSFVKTYLKKPKNVLQSNNTSS